MRKISVVATSAAPCTSLGLSAARAGDGGTTRAGSGQPHPAGVHPEGRLVPPGQRVCEYESKAKAALMEADRKECERQGDWFHTDNGVCELESKTNTTRK